MLLPSVTCSWQAQTIDTEEVVATFIDEHPTNPSSPPEMLTVIKQRLLSGATDAFGARGISVFLGPEKTYCYSEAPDADAVRKAHAAVGIVLAPGDVSEVQALP